MPIKEPIQTGEHDSLLFTEGQEDLPRSSLSVRIYRYLLVWERTQPVRGDKTPFKKTGWGKVWHVVIPLLNATGGLQQVWYNVDRIWDILNFLYSYLVLGYNCVT